MHMVKVAKEIAFRYHRFESLIIIKLFFIALIPALRIDALYKTYNICINKCKLCKSNQIFV